MANFAIFTDTSCDLNKKFRDENHIDYVKMMFSWTDKEGKLHEIAADLDWEVISAREFYDIIRSGIRIFTSQVTMQQYIDMIEPHFKKGEDVLYLACSSGLSASVKTAEMVYETELKDKYPNCRLVVVDTLRAGMAQGLIVMRAVELQKQGKSIDEIKEVIEQEKLQYKEIGIPETLSYLKRAGRVSAGAAFFGNMIKLKPILMFDDKGMNVAKEKAVGRKKAYARMAEIIKDDIVDPENQEIYLMNADCDKEDVEAFKSIILARVNVKNVIVESLGPVIGASSGPGTIIVNYKGK